MLELVGVLRLVEQDVPEAPGVLRTHRRVVGEQRRGARLEVVEVERADRALVRRVPLVDGAGGGDALVLLARPAIVVGGLGEPDVGIFFQHAGK